MLTWSDVDSDRSKGEFPHAHVLVHMLMWLRFTLRLKALQAGLWDRQFGEYEWAYHKKEMGGKDRKMFNL